VLVRVEGYVELNAQLKGIEDPIAHLVGRTRHHIQIVADMENRQRLAAAKSVAGKHTRIYWTGVGNLGTLKTQSGATEYCERQ
jgi:hypothetical protein